VPPAKYVQPIHFEDFSGKQFERLVFAYHARIDRWLSLEWFGQQGKDQGRDILGVRQVDGRKDGERVCVLCANWRQLTLTKVKSDIGKALRSPSGKPDRIRVVCGHDISAGIRDEAKKYAQGKGVYLCELWSGQEFEERLRVSTESLLRRFVQGEEFPDDPARIMKYVSSTEPVNDQEALAQLARVFDRPAFYTPISQESSLPAFKQAITDSIKAIATGIWQTRDGKELGRLRSRHDFKDEGIRMGLTETEQALAVLRARFDDLVRAGRIRHCGCNVPDCPVYFVDHGGARELEDLRMKVLVAFKRVYPQFDIRHGW
jgi:hypothetical protein